ncbi:class I SAM-dependent methyltransferase [Mucilaginibacter koreensis]
MSQDWINRWNERYSNSDFAYGEFPNEYLRKQLTKLTPVKILFPAEGEGRNAVFAAGLGWEVSAFDISGEGQKKAEQLARKNQVSIDYQVGELQTLGYFDEEFDAIALIYAHFPAAIKSQIHQALRPLLCKGGTIIFEAFSKNHLAYLNKNEKVGGPQDIESLFSIEEIQTDFANYEVIEIEELEVDLHEGLYHNGLGSVIRFVGRKR